MTGSHSRAPRRSKAARLTICGPRPIAGLFAALSLLSCGPQPIAAPKPVVRELVHDGEPVEGRVQRRGTHCGGMALTPEHAMALSTPAPAAGVRVYFRRGARNSESPIVQEATTGDDGFFKTKLPPGTYCMLLSDATAPVAPQEDQYTTVDEACVQREWESCEAVVEVEPRGRRDVSYTIQETCSFSQPCTNYSGPLPP